MSGYLREGGAGRDRLRGAVRRLARARAPRALLNAVYARLGWRGQRRFYLLFSKIFRDGDGGGFEPGSWRIAFTGREIAIPLRRDFAWLDWDSALSFLGNDQDVKRTYAALFASRLRPDLFLDIGANYGSHSVLAMAAGIPTWSFEPNPACHGRLRDWGEINGLLPRIEACALGDRDGTITFAFPERATWLGHIAAEDEAEAPGMVRIDAPMRRLDDFAAELPEGRVLIKLDAEGAEPLIIAGAKDLLGRRRPLLIFECWPEPGARTAFGAALPEGYAVYALPWSPDRPGFPLTHEAYLASPATNFIAVPAGSL